MGNTKDIITKLCLVTTFGVYMSEQKTGQKACGANQIAKRKTLLLRRSSIRTRVSSCLGYLPGEKRRGDNKAGAGERNGLRGAERENQMC